MQSGILSDDAIRIAIRNGLIEIDPFQEEQLNPTSYDVTLGEGVAVYKACVDVQYLDGDEVVCTPSRGILETKDQLAVHQFQIHPSKGLILRADVGYLMHTVERIHSNRYVPVLDGKSSLGRLFISVHETAGFGDVGFNGQFTLEVSCLHPVRLYAGMRIGQIRFHTVRGHVRSAYDQTGKYQGDLAQGPVPSQAHRMFPRTS